MSLRFAGIARQALKELGIRAVSQYIGYRLGLRSGWLRWRTHRALQQALSTPTGDLASGILPPPDLPAIRSCLTPEAIHALQQQCDEIASGVTRIFGSQTTPIVGHVASDQRDWSALRESALDKDVKLIWEPGRLGWVFPLTQAYWLSGDERHVQTFWSWSERFFNAYPPYRGWHWSSAQEVALRLVGLVFAFQRFQESPTLDAARRETLARWIAIHAYRIPPTLIYARAQNNNHLLSEAVGLFTAGCALPDHPQAKRWRQQAWQWLEAGVLAQIADSGEYIQHSVNYHRMILQLLVWATLLGDRQGFHWSQPALKRIQAAVSWLAALTDPLSGGAPNLGPNDGAYPLPLTQCDFTDHRPVLQAADRIFGGRSRFPAGRWDDFSAWLGIPPAPLAQTLPATPEEQPLTLRHPRFDSWCYLRAARFRARPGHADQLHLDLWFRGRNIAHDPGAYHYTAPPPWDNALTHTSVHNTLTLADREQMSRVGRFLYLEWAQAEVLSRSSDAIAAQHDGYRKLGLIHQRRVQTSPWGWLVEDQVLPLQSSPLAVVAACLHWQLPDWSWQIERLPDGVSLTLETQQGPLQLILRLSHPTLLEVQAWRPYLGRAGTLLYGDLPISPVWGWFSPIYAVKIPALAFGMWVSARPPITLRSEWRLPSD